MHSALRAALAATAGISALSVAAPAFAHCFVGSRFFPATLNVDDPCVADELSLPTIANFRTGDVPPNREIDISGEFSKRITDNFGISVGSTWTRLLVPGGPNAHGFQNLGTTFKYQFPTAPAGEFVVSAGLSVEWGRTGNPSVGAEKFTTLTPTVWFGKGFGDLPHEFGALRAFAVTGQFGYSVPMWPRTVTYSLDTDSGDLSADVDRHAQYLAYGGSLQFSLPYLRANIVDLGLPEVVNRLIPIVEAQFRTPIVNVTDIHTTGTVNPGIIWAGDKFQIGAQAILPLNRQSGKGPGWIAQVHFYLDDIFPTSIGRPIFASSERMEAAR
jgi:hypothetical protein